MSHNTERRRDAASSEMRCLKALVSSAFSICESELNARSRRRAQTAFARQVAMYLAHVSLGLPLRDVASEFGRDRTTAAHACRLVEDRRDDRALDYLLDRLGAAAQLWAGRSGHEAGLHNG